MRRVFIFVGEKPPLIPVFPPSVLLRSSSRCLRDGERRAGQVYALHFGARLEFKKSFKKISSKKQKTNDIGSIETLAQPTPQTPTTMSFDEKKLKKVIKEGGKRGVEIEGAASMGGLQFFCTKVDEPEGDLELLVKCVEAMNAECDPAEEERKGGSGEIGKMIFSCDDVNLVIVSYVPESKTDTVRPFFSKTHHRLAPH